MPASEGTMPQPETGQDDNRQSIPGFSGERGGRRYTLDVVQSPSRARMCGFGDKDRRPLSPALVARLRIVDIATDTEVSLSEIETSLYILTAELIDSVTLAPRSLLVPRPGGPLDYSNRTFHGSAAAGQPYPSQGPAIGVPGPSNNAGADPTAFPPGGPPSQPQSLPGPAPDVPSSFTRNLVGTTVSSAHVARDEQDQVCIFFVLQDISVRLEGEYRLRLLFTSLDMGGQINTRMSAGLAEVITPPFTCYSPRRFPGQVPPTALSRKLASQGIKISIRSADKRNQTEQEQAEREDEEEDEEPAEAS